MTPRVTSALPVLRNRMRIESTPALSRLHCTISATTPAASLTSCASEIALGAVCAAAWAIRSGASLGPVETANPAAPRATIQIIDDFVMVHFSLYAAQIWSWHRGRELGLCYALEGPSRNAVAGARC